MYGRREHGPHAQGLYGQPVPPQLEQGHLISPDPALSARRRLKVLLKDNKTSATIAEACGRVHGRAHHSVRSCVRVCVLDKGRYEAFVINFVTVI